MSQNQNIFEQAARLKVRFETSKGLLSVEDLFDLPLTSATKVNLDDLAKALHKEVKAQQDEVSFVRPVSNARKELSELKFELVKYVIAVLVAERDARRDEQERAEKKQKLLAALQDRQDQELSSLSVEELQKRIAEL